MTSVSWGPNTVTFCHGFRLRHAAIRSSQCHSVEPQPPHAYDKLCTRPCVRVNNTVIAPWQDNRDSVIIPTTLNVIIYVIAGRSVINALVGSEDDLDPDGNEDDLKPADGNGISLKSSDHYRTDASTGRATLFIFSAQTKDLIKVVSEATMIQIFSSAEERCLFKIFKSNVSIGFGF